MTANPTQPEQAPRIFGREMLVIPLDPPSYYLNTGAARFQIDFSQHFGAWVGHLACGPARDSTEGEDSQHASAAALEVIARALALAIAPLLDDAGKRELVKAAGIKFSHFPENTTSRDFEGEPEPFV